MNTNLFHVAGVGARSPVNRSISEALRKFRISSRRVLLSILDNRGSISICRVAYPKTDEASREERPVETALIQLTVETRMITQRATSLAIKLCLGGVLALSRCRQSSVLSGDRRLRRQHDRRPHHQHDRRLHHQHGRRLQLERRLGHDRRLQPEGLPLLPFRASR